MGLKKDYLDYISESIVSTLGDMRGKRMLELGDQEMNDSTIAEKTGKEYFEKRGVVHTSFDLNGLHGALKVNLARPIENPAWQGHFDIVTNSGTSQHVEPTKAQYVCFMNMHKLLQVGGVAVHLVPDILELKTKGSWKTLCNNYYSREFFEMLAEENGYSLISTRVIDGNICACLQKQSDAPFMKNRAALLRHIHREKGGIIYPGINITWRGWYMLRMIHYSKHPMEIPGLLMRKSSRFIKRLR